MSQVIDRGYPLALAMRSSSSTTLAPEKLSAGTKAGLEKARAAVKTDEAARRKYESSITDLQQKISKYRDQSLAVKTNEQYKALLQEIQF